MKGVTLRTERLILRDLPPRAAGHVARFYRENWDFHRPWEPHRDARYFEAAAQRRILSAERRSDAMLHLWLLLRQGSGHRRAIRWRGPEVIGSVTLSAIVRGSFQSCFLGYKMDARYTRRGYMSEALVAVLDYAFSAARMHRVEANVMPVNVASRGLLDTLGFREEGRARDYLRIQGRWEDHIHMVMLADEWYARPGTARPSELLVHENLDRG
ncbi:MAG: GNAT family N-acetyltransferase [Spirochaetota bacterium]